MENIQFAPASPRQIRFLEARGFQRVATWSFGDAKSMIDRIAANGWRVPSGITPEKYEPERAEAPGKKWTDNPMLDLWPSVMEVDAAKAVFLERVAHYSQFDDMSRNTLMACALAEVWRQGRRYQRDQDTAALAELAGMGQARRAVTEDAP